MYTNETLKPIQDDELYVGLDGTQWANTDKATIPELHKVTEAERPSEEDYIVTGFHINESYEQVWEYEARPIPEPPRELTYAEKRAIEYPDFRDYLDAQVKKSSVDPAIQEAGLLQEKEYLAKCLQVKVKFPKPV